MTEVSEETKMNNISVINKLIDQGKISQQTLNKIVIVNKNNNAIFRGKYDVIVQKETNWYKIFIDFSDGKPVQDREFIKKEYNLYSTFSTSYSEMHYENTTDIFSIVNTDSIKVEILL